MVIRRLRAALVDRPELGPLEGQGKVATRLGGECADNGDGHGVAVAPVGRRIRLAGLLAVGSEQRDRRRPASFTGSARDHLRVRDWGARLPIFLIKSWHKPIHQP